MRRLLPMVDRRGFPTPEHPESMSAELPEADEERLAGLAARLWPAEEYAALIEAYARRMGGGGSEQR